MKRVYLEEYERKPIVRRLARPSLAWGDGVLVYRRYGLLWFGVRHWFADIRTISERRIADGEGPFGPIWTLEIERFDGSLHSVCSFRLREIHALVAELRAASSEARA